MDRRRPIRPFEESLIQSFLRGRRIRGVRFLENGKSRSNYKINLDDGSECVVRILDRETAELEAFVMELARSAAPVPEMLYRGNGCSVYSFLPGRPLSETPEYFGRAAEILARIASIRFGIPGRIGAGGVISPWPFEGLKGFFREMASRVTVRKWLSHDMLDRLKTVIDIERAMLDEIESQSSLVHGDFNPGNILIHHGAVSGILDWEFSHSGTPFMDIGNLLRNTSERYHPDIHSGLVSGGMRLSGDWKKRAQLVDLGSQLEFLTTTRSNSFKRECVLRIENYLASHSKSK